MPAKKAAKAGKKPAAKKTTATKAASAAKAVVNADHLIMFHGQECFHCRTMDALAERLEKEEGIKITRLEVWHNEKNAELLQKTDQGMCGGVPFFWNSKTKKWLCGETDYDTLKDWAGA